MRPHAIKFLRDRFAAISKAHDNNVGIFNIDRRETAEFSNASFRRSDRILHRHPRIRQNIHPWDLILIQKFFQLLRKCPANTHFDVVSVHDQALFQTCQILHTDRDRQDQDSAPDRIFLPRGI